VIAACIHLQRLPEDRIPSIKEILAIPEFDQADPRDFGVPYFIGEDFRNNQVYIIGFGKNYQLALQTIHYILADQGCDPLDWHFFNALNQIGTLTKIGGFLSRNLKIIFIGRHLAALGIQKSYLKLVKLVQSIKEQDKMAKRKIVVITDGDRVAKKVVEKVAKNVGGRAISISSGNPTQAPAAKIAEAIKEAAYDPVLVMVDDCGCPGEGPGEQVLRTLAIDSEIDILGVVAVASNTAHVDGVPITASVTREGTVIDLPVDKEGYPEAEGHDKVKGDTVDVLNSLKIPIVIGVGDLGKMEDADLVEDGAKITTIAVEEVLKRSNFKH
jgi:stage V sporulation protein AE